MYDVNISQYQVGQTEDSFQHVCLKAQ